MKDENTKRIEIIAEAIHQATSLLEIMDDEEERLELMDCASCALIDLAASINNKKRED
tara:strand:- start:2536 stop:2709 length:174 start_codon:yes stop_codon:yes gene_type:complete